MYFEFQSGERRGATWAPTVDVCERAQEIVIFVEMPGVARTDVQISWKNGVLIITGLKRQRPPDYCEARYLCVERAYGHFRREIAINVPIDHTGAKAQLEDGLMSIHLPKILKKDEGSSIPIL